MEMKKIKGKEGVTVVWNRTGNKSIGTETGNRLKVQ
jgi:hypothetical protein